MGVYIILKHAMTPGMPCTTVCGAFQHREEAEMAFEMINDIYEHREHEFEVTFELTETKLGTLEFSIYDFE